MTDPYGVLEVSPQATDEQVNKAYKRLAKRYHPDLHPNDAAAAARMGQINQAYDEIKRMRRGEGASAAAHTHSYAHGWAESPFDGFYSEYRPTPAFRLSAALAVAVLILWLLGVLLGGTAPMQRLRESFTTASGEPATPGYPAFVHLYP